VTWSAVASNAALMTALIGWLLTLLLAVGGWIVAAVGSASSRKKAFRLDVTEHARREVIPNVIAYQQWIGSLATRLQGLGWLKVACDSPHFSAEYVSNTWWNEAEALRELLGRSNESLGMFAMLEDYEAVFPQTRDVRIALIEFHAQLVDFAHRVHSTLMTEMPPPASGSGPVNFDWLEVVSNAVNAYYDVQALAQDIRVGIQNDALATVFGTKVSAREPRVAGLPQVVASGKLWSIRNPLPVLPDTLDAPAGPG